MFTALLERAKTSQIDSDVAVVAQWFKLIRITGFRCSEYAQTRHDEYEYPSGRRVIKAFTPLDWNFFDARNRLISVHTQGTELREYPKKLRITFRHQKNRQNGQSITLVSDDAHPDICPVRAGYHIFLRSKRLGLSDSEPMGVFVNKSGSTKYLTGNKIQEVLQSIAKEVHPDLTKDELKRFSSHSGRVWALVLLDEAGMSPVFMTDDSTSTLDGRII